MIPCHDRLVYVRFRSIDRRRERGGVPRTQRADTTIGSLTKLSHGLFLFLCFLGLWLSLTRRCTTTEQVLVSHDGGQKGKLRADSQHDGAITLTHLLPLLAHLLPLL